MFIYFEDFELKTINGAKYSKLVKSTLVHDCLMQDGEACVRGIPVEFEKMPKIEKFDDGLYVKVVNKDGSLASSF